MEPLTVGKTVGSVCSPFVQSCVCLYRLSTGRSYSNLEPTRGLFKAGGFETPDPLGYEPNKLSDSSEFQGLDAAGSDNKALERH